MAGAPLSWLLGNFWKAKIQETIFASDRNKSTILKFLHPLQIEFFAL